MQVGIRARVWWRSDNDRQTLMIRRLRCERCNKIHHELPDVIVPFKRYGADVIETAIKDKYSARKSPVSSGTVRRFRRWWEAVEVHFLNVLLALVETGASFGNPPAFKEILQAVANSNNWIFAH